MDLADKVVLNEKGSTANLPTVNQLLVDLNWKTRVDLDLMVAFKTKAGVTGMIYTKELPGGNLGDPNKTPFIVHSGDQGIAADNTAKHEQIKIMKMDDLASAQIVALNFTDAKTKRADASFSEDGAKVVVQGFGTQTQKFEVELNSPEKGHVALIASIDNTSPMGAVLKMENAVYPFGELALAAIPELNRLLKH